MSVAHNVLLITGGCCHDYKSGAEIIAKALAPQGITVTHTEDASAVTRLAGGAFDCVMLYTQGEKFKEAEVDALVQFVKNGGGLVGIHSASDTNKNSAAYMKLIGS